MRLGCSVSLCCFVFGLGLQGCENPGAPCVTQPATASQKSDLLRQLDDTRYELQLRQGDVDEMLAKTHAPGVVGVSPQWQVKRNALDEKITELKIKEHDLDLQIDALK